MMYTHLLTTLLLDLTLLPLVGAALAAEVGDRSNLSHGISGPPFQPSDTLPSTHLIWSWHSLLGKRGEKLHALLPATVGYIYSHDNICNPTRSLIFSLDEHSPSDLPYLLQKQLPDRAVYGRSGQLTVWSNFQCQNWQEKTGI